MRFIERLSDYSDEAVLEELRRVAQTLGKDTLSASDLTQARVSYALLKKRFGGLREALVKAGLSGPAVRRNIPDDELLAELQKVWDAALAREGRRPYAGSFGSTGADTRTIHTAGAGGHG